METCDICGQECVTAVRCNGLTICDCCELDFGVYEEDC
jgi:hypothetical protein